MTILITGGTGFIGTRLAERCLEEGTDVRVLGQANNPIESANVRALAEAGAEVIVGSITDRKIVGEVVEGVHTVVHLAAAQHEMNIPDERFRAVNVEGTRLLLELLADRRVSPAVVHGSTIGVYGSNTGLIDENTSPAPKNIYGRTKLEGEQVATSYGDRLRVSVVRIPETYGPGDRRLLKLFRLLRDGRGFLVGSGRNLHHPLYIDDLVDGLIRAASPEAAGEVFLLAGPAALSTRRMVAEMAAAVEVNPPRMRIPMLPMLIAATALEVTLRPLRIQPPLHRRRLDFFRTNFEFSTEKAEETIGFRPQVDFAEGARRTVRWYGEEGLL